MKSAGGAGSAWARRRRRHGISTYLAAALGVTVLVVFSVLGVSGWRNFNRLRGDAMATLSASAATQASRMAATLSSTDEFLHSTVSSPAITSLDPAQCTPVLASLGRELDGTGEIAVVDGSGRIICSSDARLDALGTLPVTDALQSATVTGQSVYGAGPDFINTGSLSLRVAATIPARKPAFMVATLPFASIMGSTGNPPSSDTLMILSADRSTVLMRSPGGNPRGTTSAAATPFTRALPAGFTALTDLDGTKRIFRDSVIPGVGWRVLIGTTPANAFGPARADVRSTVLIGILLLLALGALGFALERKLARPVHRLRLAIEASGRDADARAMVEGPAEIAEVAEAFNTTIAERRELERQLSHQALHDPLTQLPNRALLADRLEQSISRCRRDGHLTAVMFLDLDRFKLVNDAHGHPVGDQLLATLAGRLTEAVRDIDTVARFGGDEFVVVADVTCVAEAQELAARLTDALLEPIELAGREVRLSGSVGMAIATGVEQPFELIRNADAAMYRAKDENRGGYVLYDDRMHAQVVDRLETERELYQALHDGELFVEYQPMFSLVTGAPVGAEALIRWRHPTRGLVGPADFIPIAEETGQILSVGEWVLRESCAQAARWHAELGQPVEVCVNLSALQLSRGDLPGIVTAAIDASGIHPPALCLEVTEGSLLGDTAAVSRRLEAIRALGVRVSVDDFGTGYSSLAYLRHLPIDELKIDRSFVTDVAEDASARAIVANIVGLGRALDLRIVAEGVETQAQLDALAGLGCDVVQGFHLWRPTAADDLAPSMFGERQTRIPVHGFGGAPVPVA